MPCGPDFKCSMFACQKLSNTKVHTVLLEIDTFVRTLGCHSTSWRGKRCFIHATIREQLKVFSRPCSSKLLQEQMNDHSAREPSHKNFCSEHVCGETRLQAEGESASCVQSLPVVTSTQILHCFAPCTWRRSVKCSSSATTRKVDRCAVIGQNTGQRIEHELLSVGLSLCSTYIVSYIVVHAVPGKIGAVRPLSGLLTERSQRFDSNAHTENWVSHTGSRVIYFSPLHPYTHRAQRLVWVPWCDSRNRASQYQIEAASWQRRADRMRAE